MSQSSVIFRCDASAAIGAGHASRCLALAEAFDYAGSEIKFVVGPETLSTFADLTTFGRRVHVLASGADDVAVVHAHGGGGLLVVDHCGRDAAFERACRPAVGQILAFDDASGRNHDCDVLLDAAAWSSDGYRHHVPPRARILCGLAYATLRSSFRAARPVALSRREGRSVRNVLVSCGATDPGNLTQSVISVLEEFAPSVRADVVLSSQAPHLDRIRRVLPDWASLHVDARNMSDLITAADIAVGTPGVTSYERAALGLPTVLIMVAENQRGIYNTFVSAGAAVGAGVHDEVLPSRLSASLRTLLDDAGQRAQLAAISSQMVDGRGPVRIMLALVEPGRSADGRPVRLRLAEPSDEQWLLELQREPSTRRFARNPEIPSSKVHHAWLTRTLADPRRSLFIIELDGLAVGLLRLDELKAAGSQRVLEVSIALNPHFSRRGIATEALQFARRLLSRARLYAEVAPENFGSRRLFLRAGFTQTSAETFTFDPH